MSASPTVRESQNLRLYRVPEIAEMLGVGRTTIYALIKSGALPSVRVAGCRRVADADLRTFIELSTEREISSEGSR